MSVLRLCVLRSTKDVLERVIWRAVPAALVLAGVLASHATAATARAVTSSAQGNVTFTSEDGETKTLRFNAAADGDGRVEGGMSFSGPAEIPAQDVDGAGYEGFTGAVSNLLIEARFDGVVVQGNRAVMSGTVSASNLGEYIGRRVLLVVEDNGDAGADKLTWGLYKPADITWTPSDYERGGRDDGWSLAWTATDYEREDDRGINVTRSTDIDCHTFPLDSHDFAYTRGLEGDITVGR